MQKNYYAIIPADVRYDKELSPNAKLLYGEITALCNEKGYCWAGNGYFGELYGKDKSTISRWIKQLEEKGYITREVVYKEGTLEIENRYMRICNGGIGKNASTPIRKNERDNNTSFNTTFNNQEEEEEEANKKLNPFRFFEENGFGTIGGHISEKIISWCEDLSDELVLEAMKIAVEYGAKNWSYVERILKTWSEKKITSVSQVHAELMAFKEKQAKRPVRKGKVVRQENIPEWFEENPYSQERSETTEDTDSKKQEIEAMLKQLNKNKEE